MNESEERRQTERRSLTSLCAGPFKLICLIHTVCCIGMIALGIVTFNKTRKQFLVLSPHFWSFILASKLFVLAVTDAIIATKGKGNVRNKRDSVSALIILQAVLSVLSIPCYVMGYLVVYMALYRNSRHLALGTILYCISFVSSVFVNCICCYASIDCGTHNRHNTNQEVVSVSAIGMNEELTDPPSYTRYSHVEPPPSYTPSPRVDQSLEQLNEDPPPRYTPYPQAVTERAIPTSEITQNTENERSEVGQTHSLQTARSLGTRAQAQMQGVQINSLNVRSLEPHFKITTGSKGGMKNRRCPNNALGFL